LPLIDLTQLLQSLVSGNVVCVLPPETCGDYLPRLYLEVIPASRDMDIHLTLQRVILLVLPTAILGQLLMRSLSKQAVKSFGEPSSSKQ
jgi:hypothetical protein